MKTLYIIIFFILLSVCACEKESVYLTVTPYCWECQHTVITKYGIQTVSMQFPVLGDDTISYTDNICGYTEDMMQSYLRYMSKDDTLEHSTITREVNCKQL